MNVVTNPCVQCGRRNSSHRLWCEQCGTPVPSPSTPRVSTEDHSSTDRARLYGRILQDLGSLLSEGNVSRETYDVIASFYQGQIATIDEQTADRNKARQLQGLVVSARLAAHSGRFQDAIELLRQGHADHRGEHRLEEMIAEISGRHEQREKVLRTLREADLLLGESTADVELSRLEQLADELEQQRQLDPNNKRIITTLHQVEAQIGFQQAQRAEQARRARRHDAPVYLHSPSGPSGRVERQRGEGNRADPPLAEARTSLKRRVKENHTTPSFEDGREEIPSPRQRLIEAASHWSSIVKPFLLDNVGWFVGAFLVVTGFVILIVTFWGTIEQNRVLMHSLVFGSLAIATGTFFSVAYFIRRKHPQLETSSNVLLVIVALLIPLVFAAALLTSLVPAAAPDLALLSHPG